MIEQKAKELIEKEGRLLSAALGKAARAYQEKPSISNLQAYQTAKKAYADYLERQQAKVFNHLNEVFHYLQEQGFKVSQRKVYKDKHLIPRQSDGTILKDSVDQYAKAYLHKRNDTNIEITEKLKWETEIAKAKALQLQKKNEVIEGMYILRSEVEQQLAARAAFLKNSLEGFFYSMVPIMIEKAEGKKSKTPEVIEFCLNELYEYLDKYSRPIIIEEEGE